MEVPGKLGRKNAGHLQMDRFPRGRWDTVRQPAWLDGLQLLLPGPWAVSWRRWSSSKTRQGLVNPERPGEESVRRMMALGRAALSDFADAWPRRFADLANLDLDTGQPIDGGN